MLVHVCQRLNRRTYFLKIQRLRLPAELIRHLQPSVYFVYKNKQIYYLSIHLPRLLLKINTNHLRKLEFLVINTFK